MQQQFLPGVLGLLPRYAHGLKWHKEIAEQLGQANFRRPDSYNVYQEPPQR